MGLRLRHTSLFLTYVLAPLCAISNFNYEQVAWEAQFPEARIARIASSGLVHRAFPIQFVLFITNTAINDHACVFLVGIHNVTAVFTFG